MNFLHWIVHNLPFGWLAVVVLLGTIAGTIAIALLCHWILRYRSNEETSEELRQLFSVGAVLFSVIIGFLVVVTWQKYLDVEDNVVNEASAVQSAYEESRLLIDANGQTIRDGLRQYAEAVVDDEWPKLAVRQESAQAADSLAELWGAASGLQYADDGQITIGTSVAESLETISRERQSRLYESQVGLPWFFLGVHAGVRRIHRRHVQPVQKPTAGRAIVAECRARPVNRLGLAVHPAHRFSVYRRYRYPADGL